MSFSEQVQNPNKFNKPLPSDEQPPVAKSSFEGFSKSVQNAEFGGLDEDTFKANQVAEYLKIPGQEAREIYDIEKATGLAPAFIKDNIEDLRQKVKEREFNPREFFLNSPNLKKYAEKYPDRAPLIKNGMESLSAVERALREAKMYKDFMGDNYDLGKDQTKLAFEAFDRAWGKQLNEEEYKALKDKVKEKSLRTGAYGYNIAESGLGMAAGQLPQMYETLFKSLATGGAAGLAVGAPVALVNPAVGVAVGAKTAAGTFKVSNAARMFRLMQGLSFSEFEDMTYKDDAGKEVAIDRETAMGLSLVSGVASTALELFSLGVLTKPLQNIPAIKRLTKDGLKEALKTPASRSVMLEFAKNVGASVIAEGATEGAQSYVQSMLGNLWKDGKEGKIEDVQSFLKSAFGNTQAWNDALEEGLAGASASVWLGGAMSTPSALIQSRQKSKFKKEQERLVEIADNYEKAKAAGVPEEVAIDSIQDVAEQNGQAEIFFQADEFKKIAEKNNLDPVELYAAISNKSADEARASLEAGSDLEIGLRDYIEKVHGTQIQQDILQAAKNYFEQGSQQELNQTVEQFKSELDSMEAENDAVKAEQERVAGLTEEQATKEAVLKSLDAKIKQEEVDPITAKQKEVETIYNEAYQALEADMIAAGKTAAEAKANATLFASVQASYYSTQPNGLELFRANNLKLQNEAINQARNANQEFVGKTVLTQNNALYNATIKSKNFKNFFGKSKTVDAQGNPLVLYHGTNQQFEAFEMFNTNRDSSLQLGQGFYFTTDLNQARQHGDKIVEAFVKIENPMLEGQRNITKDQIRAIVNYAQSISSDALASFDGMSLDEIVELYDSGNATDIDLVNVLARDMFKDLGTFFGKVSDFTGYDGIQVNLGDTQNFVAFKSNQIKSTENRGSFDFLDPRIYFQNQPTNKVLGFYSKLRAVVNDFKFKAAPAKDVIGMIKNLKGVKPQEIEFSGVIEWLETIDGKVRKEDLLNFLDKEGLKLGQTVMGESPAKGTFKVEFQEVGIIDAPDHLFDMWRYNAHEDIRHKEDHYLEALEDYSQEQALYEFNVDELMDLIEDTEDELYIALESGEFDRDEAIERWRGFMDDYYADSFEEIYIDRQVDLYHEDYRNGTYGSIYEYQVEGFDYRIEADEYNAELYGPNGHIDNFDSLEEAKEAARQIIFKEEVMDAEWETRPVPLTDEVTMAIQEASKEKAQMAFSRLADYFVAGKRNPFLYAERDVVDGLTSEEMSRVLKDNYQYTIETSLAEGLTQEEATASAIRFGGRDLFFLFKDRSDDPFYKDLGERFVFALAQEFAREEEQLAEKGFGDFGSTISTANIGELSFILKKQENKKYQLEIFSTRTAQSELFDIDTDDNDKAMQLANSVIVDQMSRQEDGQEIGIDQPTKKIADLHRSYEMNGGSNKREFWLTMDGSGYKDNHYALEGNIVHARTADLQDMAGNKYLLIDELQSDPHQRERKKKADQMARAKETLSSLIRAEGKDLGKTGEDLNQYVSEQVAIETKKETQSQRWLDALTGSGYFVPSKGYADLPFNTTGAWTQLMFKRMLDVAVKEGKNYVVIQQGSIIAGRYGYGELISEINYRQLDNGQYEVITTDKEGRELSYGRAKGNIFNADELSSWFSALSLRILNPSSAVENNLATAKEDGSYTITGDHIKVDVGLAKYYNETLPSEVNEYLRKGKFGTKLKRMDMSDPNRFFTPLTDKRTGQKLQEAFVLEITPEIRERVLREGQELFQDQGGVRGYITFEKYSKNFDIYLTEMANSSTVPHELAHYFLEQIGDIASLEDASERNKILYKDILEWLGAPSRDDITVEMHEKFADAFTQYLANGRAPSAKLAQVFRQFRKWLAHIYRALKGDEVDKKAESIFDRILVAEDMVEAAYQNEEISPLFGEVQGILTEKEQEEYGAVVQEARLEAEEWAIRNEAAKMRAERKKINKELEAEFRATATEELMNDPKFRAYSMLVDKKMPDGSPIPAPLDKLRISLDSVKREFGQDLIKRLPKFYYKDGDMDISDAMILLGFKDPQSFAEDMIKARSASEEIDARVASYMAQAEVQMQQEGDVAQIVDKIRGEGRARVLQKEMSLLLKQDWPKVKGLIKKAGYKIPDDKSVIQDAKDAIGSTPIHKIKPNKYYLAEKRARKNALDAALNGDFEKAFIEKRKELYAMRLLVEAKDALKKAEKAKSYAKTFEKDAKRRRIAKSSKVLIESVDNILAAYQFVEVPVTQLDRTVAARAAEDLKKKGYEVTEDDFAPSAQEKNYKELTPDELEGVIQSLRAISKLSSSLTEVEKEGKKISLERVKSEIISTIAANRGKKKLPDQFNKESTAMRVANQFMAAGLKPELLLQVMDGAEFGPLQDYIFKPIDASENKSLVMQKQYGEKIKAMFQNTYSKQELNEFSSKKYKIEGIEQALTREMIVVIALYQGTDYSRQGLLDGFGWTQQAVDNALDLLQEKEWKLVQSIFNTLDELWPMSSEVERVTTGRTPQKVQASQIKTKYGNFEGGYFPIDFDRSAVDTADKLNQDNESLANMIAGDSGMRRPTVRARSLNERSNTGGRPFLLSINTLQKHVNETIHDIAYRQALMDVYKIINEPDINKALKEGIGVNGVNQLQDWVMSFGRQSRVSTPIEKTFSWIRQGTTYVNLGMKMMTAAVQPLGYTVSVKSLGGKYAWHGVAKTYGGLWKSYNRTHDLVMSKSIAMQNRAENIDRNLSEIYNQFKLGKETKFQNFMASNENLAQKYFYFIAMFDRFVTVPTWIAAYDKALAGAVDGIKQGDEKMAIYYADKMVRTTQGNGSKKDLSAVQRDTGMMSMFTMHYSYFNMLYNQIYLSSQDYKRTGSKADAAWDAAWLWLIPVILESYIRAETPDLDEEDEEWLKFAAQIATYPLNTIPVVRDFVSKAVSGFEPKSPLHSFADSALTIMSSAPKIFTDEEFTKKDARAAADFAGVIFKLPSKQAFLTASVILDEMENETSESFGEFLYRAILANPPKK